MREGGLLGDRTLGSQVKTAVIGKNSKHSCYRKKRTKMKTKTRFSCMHSGANARASYVLKYG